MGCGGSVDSVDTTHQQSKARVGSPDFGRNALMETSLTRRPDADQIWVEPLVSVWPGGRGAGGRGVEGLSVMGKAEGRIGRERRNEGTCRNVDTDSSAMAGPIHPIGNLDEGIIALGEIKHAWHLQGHWD